jgi:hypothetical protein
VSDENTDPIAEASAMKTIGETLKGLPPESIRRILLWANDAYGVTIPASRRQPVDAPGGDVPPGVDRGNGRLGERFSELGDLFAAAAPTTDADKALVVGYWFQYIEGQPDLSAQTINTALKHLGEGVGNITTAFDSLKARKPAPVIQLKKAGTAKQSRKTYKLTAAGKNAVELMIAPGPVPA